MNADPLATPVALRLELTGIGKQYPGVKANDGVSLRVKPGEIHAVLGENGAGKSTLMKIIYGAVHPDEGEIRFNGQPVAVRNPHEARALGISMVFQHFSLFDTLSAAENVWLGLDRSMPLARVIERIREVAGEYGLEVDPLRPVHTLSVGERQRVEIVRALLTQPQLLILDEPTSVLTPQAVERLFVTLRRLAAQGCSILYISHKLDEIRALCHQCTVLRGGRVTGEVDPTKESNASLSRLMIGAEPPQLAHREAHTGEVALAVHGLDLPMSHPFGIALSGIAFEVRRGEILGIAGVSGNGQSELMAALSGEDRRSARGAVTLNGRDIAQASPRRRRRLGLHYVPEERLGRGAVPTLSLAANTLLTRTGAVGRAGWLRIGEARRLADVADPPLQREGRRPGRGGPEPVGRQPAEVHRGPRDRRRAEGAGGRAADVGRGRRRRRADPRRAARAARRRLRAAHRERGARRAVRDLRPPGRDRARPPEPGPRHARRHRGADRRLDVGPVGRAGTGAGGRACCGLRRGRSRPPRCRWCRRWSRWPPPW